jgi:hypothetical protein
MSANVINLKYIFSLKFVFMVKDISVKVTFYTYGHWFNIFQKPCIILQTMSLLDYIIAYHFLCVLHHFAIAGNFIPLKMKTSYAV